jgi:hypothetical protein
MTDPLQNLLQATDAASAPSAPDDLVAKVHRRQKSRTAKSRQLKIGATAACAALAFALILTHQPRPEGQGRPTAPLAQNPPTELATARAADAASLLREAADIKSEADALEKLLAAHQRQTHLTELAAEYDRLLVATSAPDPEEAALERAAARAICQADFLLETLNDRLAAVAAYRNIAEQFPNTRWAMIAQDNLSRLEMN